MKKSLLLLVCFGWLISFAIAEVIPYPVDSAEYQSYKESMIGQEIRQSPALTGIPQSIQYERSSRNGLLVPLDNTFTMALAGNDDGYTAAIQLPFTFDFYGIPQTHFFINNNGNVSFGGGYSTYTAYGFPVNGYPMLAPFWADVDTRPAQSGKVHYRIEPHRVVVTWPNVGYYGNYWDKLNTFQLIFTDGTDPLIGIGNNVAFSYGDMQWTTGSASGGSGGFGGTPATVGINKGDGVDYALIGRFNHEGTDYNGPFGAPSGVSFLDNQLFIFSSQQLVLPPYFTGVPAQTTLINRAETRNFQIAAVSSSPSKTVNAYVSHDFTSGFNYQVISGNPCHINISITGNQQNMGEHWIAIEAYDSGEPPLMANTSFSVKVINQPAQPGDYILVAEHSIPALHVMDINTNELYGPYLQGQLGNGNLLDVVISHRGDFALVSNFENNSVYKIGLNNPYEPVIADSFNVGFRAEDITLSQDDRFALVADGSSTQYLAVIDLQSRAIVQTINISPHYAQGVELGPDGKVLVNDTTQGRIHQYLLDLQTGVLSYSGVSISLPNAINSVISPDGKYAIACSNNSGSLLLSLNDDNSITVLQNLGFGSQSAVYSADQQMALIYSFGNGQDKILLYAVNEDGSMVLQNSIPLPRYSTGGYYGVDVLAISRDKNWAFAGNPNSSMNFPLTKVNLTTAEITEYPLYNAAGIALGSMGLSAYFNAQVFPEAGGFRVSFQNLSFGNPNSYLWEFGDGSSSTAFSPIHIYAQPGIYTVRLTVYKGSQSNSYELRLELSTDGVYHLSAASSPYTFNEDLVIPEGGTLIVDPGVQVNFGVNAGLFVYGHFQANNAIFTGNAVSGWKGIFIDSRVNDITLAGCQIKNAKTALKVQNSSFQISNLVMSKTQDFPQEKGLHLIGACNMQVNGLQITGYRPGIVMNNQSRVASSSLLSNIRIRNSGSTSREENQGMIVNGAIALNLNNVEIENYANALSYDTAGYSLGRTTALLSNIRIRNSGSTSRTSLPALKIQGANSVELSAVDIENYGYAIEMKNNEGNRATANPLLSNIRIRNSGSTSRQSSVGISMLGNISPQIQNSEIEDFNTGIQINSQVSGRVNNSALLSNIRIRNSGSTSRDTFTGVKLQNLTTASCSKLTVFYQSADSTRTLNNLAGSAIWIAGGNATISRSTIWGLENGLNVQSGTSATLSNSIIWSATGSALANPIVVAGGTASVSNSNISYAAGVYPGTSNMAVDPCFVNPAAGDYELKPRSPLRDLGIGAEDFDYESHSNTYNMVFAPGWNMMGMPLLAPAGEDTPVAFFGDALSPFYVNPYYTSILQMNPFSIAAPGVLAFQTSNSYSVPAKVYPGPGYWIRNPQSYPVTVTLNGVLDTEPYQMKVPGVATAQGGFFMLANPYDVDISYYNGGITMDPALFNGWIRLYDPYSNNISAINLFSDSNAKIPAFAAFIVKSDFPNASIYFNYPSAQRNEIIHSQAEPRELVAGQKPLARWELILQAVADNQVATAVMGIAKDASDTYDPMDVPDLPFDLSPSPLRLRVFNPDWENLAGYFNRDIRNADAQSWIWPLKLDLSNMAQEGSYNGEIRLGLQEGQKLPGGYSFQLVNPQTGETINLAERSYTLSLNLNENDSDFGSWEYPLLLEVRKQQSQPETPALALRNYPNPFNPSTTISFSLPGAGKVEVVLYNIKGQKVRSLLTADKAAGIHSVVWDGKDDKGLPTASGLYYCKVKSPAGSQILKIMMLK